MRHLLPLILIATVQISYGQLSVEWQAHYQSNKWHQYSSVVECHDGGFAMCGANEIFEKSKSPTEWLALRKKDILLLRTNKDGQEIWRKYLGGSHYDSARKILQTQDGGFIIGGNTRSTDGDVSFKWGTTRHHDAWMIKTDSLGNIEWERVLGGTESEHLWDIDIAADGGYIAVGYTWSTDGLFNMDYRESCRSANHPHMFAVKLDTAGNISWVNAYNHSFYMGTCVTSTFDGGFAIGGAYSHHHSNRDGSILKIDAMGETEWVETYGGSDWYDNIYQIMQTEDHGFVFAANTCSFDRDIKKRKRIVRNSNVWIGKTDVDGKLMWSENWGDTVNGEFVKGLTHTHDGNILVIADGLTHGKRIIEYWSADLNTDIKILKYSMQGKLMWMKNLTGYGQNEGRDIISTRDGGYLILGSIGSRSDDYSINRILGDSGSVSMIKLNPKPEMLATIQASVELDIELGTVHPPKAIAIKPTKPKPPVYNPEVKAKIIAYPNPTTGLLTVEIDQPGNKKMNQIDFQLYDGSGRLIVKNVVRGSGKYTFDFTIHPTGYYLLQLMIQGEPRTIPFIKK